MAAILAIRDDLGKQGEWRVQVAWMGLYDKDPTWPILPMFSRTGEI